jgi:hypothetical protein
MGYTPSQRHGKCDLEESTWDSDIADGQEVTEGKVHADAEHQQDDADFCELRRQPGVGDKARSKRSNCYARQKIAEERR